MDQLPARITLLWLVLLGIFRLHQYDRPKSNGKLDGGDFRRNQKAVGHTNGTGNGTGGSVRGALKIFSLFAVL